MPRTPLLLSSIRRKRTASSKSTLEAMRLFEQFTIYDVMCVIGLDTSKVRSSGGYFDCPICGGKKKFNVNPSIGHGGVCRCAKCSAGGDKLDLFILYRMNPLLVNTASSSGRSFYQKPSERDRKDGMAELARELRLSRSNPEHIKKSHDAQKKVETATEDQTVASPEKRHAVYTAFLKLLSLTTAHREALMSRGLNVEEIERLMFRSTPMFGRPQLAKKLIEQGLQLDNIPGFFKTGAMSVDMDTGEATPEWSVYCPDSGYFIPIRDMDGNIVSMQIRLNKPTTSKDKYRFFSSYRETLEGGRSCEKRNTRGNVLAIAKAIVHRGRPYQGSCIPYAVQTPLSKR